MEIIKRGKALWRERSIQKTGEEVCCKQEEGTTEYKWVL